jgi:hypothetical protein
MKDVGREVCLLFQPMTLDSSCFRDILMVLSMRRQTIKAGRRISPRASIRRGVLRNSALTNRGSLRNPKFCSTECSFAVKRTARRQSSLHRQSLGVVS